MTNIFFRGARTKVFPDVVSPIRKTSRLADSTFCFFLPDLYSEVGFCLIVEFCLFVSFFLLLRIARVLIHLAAIAIVGRHGHRAIAVFYRLDPFSGAGIDALIAARRAGEEGRVIGISARYGAGENIGLLIPFSTAKQVVSVMSEQGQFVKTNTGIIAYNLNPVSRKALQVGPEQAGLVVSHVLENSPAARAGIERWDIITAVKELIRLKTTEAMVDDIDNLTLDTPAPTSVEPGEISGLDDLCLIVVVRAALGGADKTRAHLHADRTQRQRRGHAPAIGDPVWASSRRNRTVAVRPSTSSSARAR